MPQTFVRGQKSKLSALTGEKRLELGVGLSSQVPGDMDVSLFGVDANGKLSDDRYFIFYNQKRSPEGALESIGGSMSEREQFRLDLNKLPTTIDRLVLTVSLDGTGSMNGLRGGYVRLSASDQEVMRFEFAGADFGSEKAIILLEIYRKGEWRVAAVGQGFNGGLSALLAHFGGEEVKPETKPEPAPPPASAPPTVNLSKVTLEKRGDQQRVNLSKRGSNQVHINLNWQGPATRKFAQKPPDLDLGCMFMMQDGDSHVIQPVGGYFGDKNGPPYILLDKDDRSGASQDGENLTIYRPDLIDRVMVFTFIYEGASGFSEVDARLSVTDPGGREIVINLDNPDSNRTFCSICTIENRQGDILITKEERYFAGHREADQHYGFGFNWRRGRK